MEANQIIEKALKDLSIGQAMIEQGNERCHNARKTLESVYSPAPLKAKKSKITPEQWAKLLSKKDFKKSA